MIIKESLGTSATTASGQVWGGPWAQLRDLSVAVVLTDRSGAVRRWNRGAEVLFGWLEDDVLGRQLVDLLVCETYRTRAAGILEEALSGEIRVTSLDANRSDASRIPVEVVLAPVVLAAPDGIGIVAIAIDASDELDPIHRKRITDALLAATERERAAADQLRVADEIKHRFLESLSHELRTPLTSIRGWAELLALRGTGLDPERLAEIFERLRRNAARLDDLIGDLMETDRLGRGLGVVELRPLRIDELARRVLDGTPLGGRTVSLAAEPVTMQGDAVRIKKILHNLLDNVARHTPEGTQVTVTITSEDDLVQVVVVDDGPGVPLELLDVAFDPFTHGPLLTPSSPGTGIGLTLVRRFAEMHGGRAWITIPEEGGTSVHVAMPLTPAPRPELTMMAAAVPSSTAADSAPDTEMGPVILHALAALRAQTGLDVTYLTQFTARHQIILAADGDAEALGLSPGSRMPLEDTYCSRLASERIPGMISDTSTVAEVAHLPVSKVLKCYLGVPIRLPNGQVFGSLCAASASPTELRPEQLDLARSLARIIAAEVARVRQTSDDVQETQDQIRTTIRLGKVRPVFQSIVDLATGDVVGVEALSRFFDDALRAPTMWFAEAHQVGLGLDLERAAIEAALGRLGYLDEGHHLAINVSPSLILSGWIDGLLGVIDPHRLVLEISEHATIGDYSAVGQALAAVRSAGVRIAVDDAGAGNASLQHALYIAPDILKLDTSLVRGIATVRRRQAMAGALVRYAEATGAIVVAEGIQDAQTLATVRDLGVHQGQGWQFDRPGPLPLRTTHHQV